VTSDWFGKYPCGGALEIFSILLASFVILINFVVDELTRFFFGIAVTEAALIPARKPNRKYQSARDLVLRSDLDAGRTRMERSRDDLVPTSDACLKCGVILPKRLLTTLMDVDIKAVDTQQFGILSQRECE